MIQRDVPVWALVWMDVKGRPTQVLGVGTWSSSFSVHSINGNIISEDSLSFVPSALSPQTILGTPFPDHTLYSCFPRLDCALAGGTDKKVRLIESDGMNPVDLFEMDEWIRSVVAFHSADSVFIAASTNSGTIEMHQMKLESVFCFFDGWFVQRVGLHAVLLRNLDTEKAFSISYEQLVLRLAVYKVQINAQRLCSSNTFFFLECLSGAYHSQGIPVHIEQPTRTSTCWPTGNG